MDVSQTKTKRQRRRLGTAVLLAIATIAGLFINQQQATPPQNEAPPTGQPVQSVQTTHQRYQTAAEALTALPVKGRSPKTGYSRSQFGSGWLESGGCDTRNRILARDLKEVRLGSNNCWVVNGRLPDPYTGKEVAFSRGQGTSDDVQIDHVVALSDAWQKGAQFLTPLLREQFANDGLNLLAVAGNANMNKGDSDAATWLPPNTAVRCSYVARQISVKLKYSLWVTSAEKTAMQNVLNTCPREPLPI